MATNDPGHDTRTPEEIQQEIHETQQRLGRTLDQIQDRLKPQRLRDQVMDMFNDGGRDGGTIPDTVRDNALPLAMIGLGIGWLMWSATSQDDGSSTYRAGGTGGSRGRLDRARDWTGDRIDDARERMQHAGESLRRRAEDMRHRADDMRHRAGERISEMRERHSGHDNVPDYRRTPSGGIYGETGEAVGGSYDYGHPGEYHYRPASGTGTGGGAHRMDRVREAAHGYGEQARHYGEQARHYGQAASHRAREGYQSFWHMVDEHPLLAGAIGFTVGAAVGAAFPSSRYEDELVGDYSDAMWERSREYGEDYVERASDVARHAAEAGYEAARDTGMEEARKQGLTGEEEAQKDRTTTEGRADERADER
ncbi:MAG TPA: DUF3618 domain-containing protein [Arenibaculum sp.]|nr:DUF3618 domain-containing protein [Arenibaculum sp.]